MIEITCENGLIMFRMIGEVTDADWNAVLPQFEDVLGMDYALRIHGGTGSPFNVLMDWERLRGWQLGARTTCTLFCMDYQDVVGRMAIIADAQWQGEALRLADVYKNAEVRLFDPARRDAAQRWLQRN